MKHFFGSAFELILCLPGFNPDEVNMKVCIPFWHPREDSDSSNVYLMIESCYIVYQPFFSVIYSSAIWLPLQMILVVVESWKEALTAIFTYAKGDQFSRLCGM